MATRRERVVLDLEDNFSGPMLRAAAATELLNQRVNALSRNAVESRRVNRDLGDGQLELAKNTDRAAASIDRYSGRLSLLVSVAGALGPALVPIGALAVPAVAGLAAQFGFAALAAGTAIGAFQGVGDALKAMNKAHLEPTAENLRAVKIAMQDISPEARKFVRELQKMGPLLKDLRDTAATGMFPGLTEGLDAMVTRLPDVQRIVAAVAGELGDIGAAGGKSLAGARWDDFFNFLATDAPSALSDMAAATGNVTHALAEMWMAFDPMNDDFSSWLVDVTAKFDNWATSLSGTNGFAEFMDYISKMGPQVGQTLGALADGLLQIVEAAAPVGGPVLNALEGFAKAVAAIADSDLGTPIFGMVTALSALNLAMRTTSALSKTTFGGPVVTGMRNQGTALKGLHADWTAYNAVTRTAQGRAQSTASQMMASRAAAERLGGSLRSTAVSAGKAGAMVGGLALMTSGAGDSMGVANTASLALLGTMGGPWGVALGAAVGATIDLYHAGDEAAASITRLNAAIAQGDYSAMSRGLAEVQAHLEDFKNVTGFGDMFGDIAQQMSATFRGDFLGKDLENAFQRGLGAINGGVAANALTSITDGFAETSAAAARATSSVQGFAAALESLNSNLTRREALRSYTESLLNARAAIKEQGQTLTKTGQAFKGHTRAGLESQRMLDRIAASALNAAKDMAPLKGARYLQNARKDFVQVATSMGMSRASARALAKQLLSLDRTNANPKVKVDTAAAFSGVSRIKSAINSITGKTVTVTVVRRQVGAGATAGGSLSARGNIFHYAQGDVANRHMPELAGPGPTRVWREPETQGEAYIPLANDDRRPRARSIAAETVSLLGGEVEWFARGGTRGGGNGGDNGGRYRTLTAAIQATTKALEKSKQAIDKETAVRDAIVAKRNDLASSVTGAFKTDLFGKRPENFSWMSPAQQKVALTKDVFSTLRTDTANAKQFHGLLYGLSKKGLDGDALAELAASGDMERVRAFSSLSKQDIGTYESLYKQRAAATNAVGAYAGSAAFGAAQGIANKHLATLVAQNKVLTAKLAALEKQKRTIHVHEAHNARATAKEVARRQAHAGAR